MVTGKRKITGLIYGLLFLALLLLFLASSTDLIIKERENPVYQISVVVEEASDDSYVNFRKGVDQAATEFNADVSFITLYEGNRAAHQMDMVRREQEYGARAIVLVPVEEQALQEALTAEPLTVPLILCNAEELPGLAAGQVEVDFRRMGEQLAERILERHGSEKRTYLFRSGRDNSVKRRFEEGLRGILTEAGYELRLVSGTGSEAFRTALETLPASGMEDAVLIALDPASLQAAAAILKEMPALRSSIEGLYGRGSSAALLNALDGGFIDGLCVTDDFSAGYLCVRQALEAVEGKPQEPRVLLDSFYIERQDLRKEQYEKLLYPIE